MVAYEVIDKMMAMDEREDSSLSGLRNHISDVTPSIHSVAWPPDKTHKQLRYVGRLAKWHRV